MQAVVANGGGGDVVQKPQQVVAAAPPPQAALPPPPHWVAMPFAPPGAAAMVMQHQMAPAPPQFAPHFVPFHAVGPPPPPQPRAAPPPVAVAMGSPAPHAQGGGGGQEENKTIWVGDLHYWMDENYLHSCFGYTGEVSEIESTPRLLPKKSTDLGHGLAIPNPNLRKKSFLFVT